MLHNCARSQGPSTSDVRRNRALVKSDSDPVSLGWGPRLCISNQVLGDASGGRDHPLRKEDSVLELSGDLTQNMCHEAPCELGSPDTEVTCFLSSS